MADKKQKSDKEVKQVDAKDKKKNPDELPRTKDLATARRLFPHLKSYTDELAKRGIHPEYVLELTREMQDVAQPNFIYPVGDPTFIHVFKEADKPTQYKAIEPRMADEEQALYDQVMSRLVDVAYKHPVPDNILEMGPVLLKLLDEVVSVGKDDQGFVAKRLNPKIHVSQHEYEKIRYFLLRNRIGYGQLEPLFLNPYLEDIHCTGVGTIKTVHKIFGMVYTDIGFKDDNDLNKYTIEVTERVERPASDAHSVIDAMMPDGSRANFIYGRDISLEGSSFTLRKFSKIPVSVTQLINWGTISAELAAYLWIALENGMNLFVCGETASGKTTTLNAISAFIKPEDKVYTVENTPEVTMPHDVWQHLLTREAGKDSDVTYLDLLIAALRSRPNYIIVGEIRGEEGAIAFQAMQTGHPVMSTFHAGDVTTMIQRITSHPISVPITFVDNLNLCLIQCAVYRNHKLLRRCLSLTELERYYAPANKVVTREVFSWNSVDDQHLFRGLFNSYILEHKIAKLLGFDDPRKIYAELDLRAKILKKMVERKIFNYYDVWEIVKKFHFSGKKGLPFDV